MNWWASFAQFVLVSFQIGLDASLSMAVDCDFWRILSVVADIFRIFYNWILESSILLNKLFSRLHYSKHDVKQKQILIILSVYYIHESEEKEWKKNQF